MFPLTETRKRWIILTGMLYMSYVFLMHKWGHQGDMLFWMDWSKYMYNNGFTHIYDNKECNYLPAYLYFLLFHVKIQGNLTDIQDNLYTIKYYTFIFDILGAYLAVWFVKDEFKKMFYFLLLIFNIAFIYNTTLWGQVDAIFTCWGFAAIVLAIERKAVFSVLCLLIALNFKLQALVFIPVVGLLILPQLLSKDGLKKLAMIILFGGIIQTIILLPFIITGRLYQVAHVITDAVGHYPYPSVGAFNLWSLFLYNTSIEGMYELTDATRFGFLSYKQIGNLLFFAFTFLAVFPLLKYLYVNLIKKESTTFPLSKVFLIAALIALNFYFFNTEMHERYAHPAIISLAAYAFYSSRFFPLILGSLAYFLNLERICWYLALHNDTYNTSFIFNPKLIAFLYLILIGTSYFLLFSKAKQSENDILLKI